ncbi:hypothetical protein KR018_010679, partial [Drosophila ironensis]
KHSELVYKVYAGVMVIRRTLVHRKLRGQGVGQKLAKAALDYALLNGYFIVIECQFVRDYIHKYNPHYARYIIE